jgi:hypothetical protein
MLIATISHQRSGTKLLASLLSSTGVVEFLGEIFNPEANDPRTFRNYAAQRGLDYLHKRGSFLTMSDYMASFGSLDQILHFDLMFNQIESACVSWNDMRHPFIYSFMRSTKIFPILLTRDAEEIFVSNKILEKSSLPHQYKGEEAPQCFGTLVLRRAEFDVFKAELEFQYMMARRVFGGHPFFYEIDYSAISGGSLPDDLFPLIEKNAHALDQFFDWRNFGPLDTLLIKNKPLFSVEWE